MEVVDSMLLPSLISANLSSTIFSSSSNNGRCTCKRVVGIVDMHADRVSPHDLNQRANGSSKQTQTQARPRRITQHAAQGSVQRRTSSRPMPAHHCPLRLVSPCTTPSATLLRLPSQLGSTIMALLPPSSSMTGLNCTAQAPETRSPARCRHGATVDTCSEPSEQ